MRMPTTVQVGSVVLFAAVTGFLGANYWVKSRTLRAVDMPVSLARGMVSTGTFNINAHGFYSIFIADEQGGNSHCNVGLETRRISSIGGLPVYRYQWLDDENRSAKRNTIAGDFLGGFEGKPGNYHLEIEVVSDTGCLDAGKPRLYIIASSNDFDRWNNRLLNSFLISFVFGSLGFALLIIGIRARFRWHSPDNVSLEFPELPYSIRIYPVLHRVKAAPWPPFFAQIGLLYSYILVLLILPAVVVSFTFRYGQPHYGLYVLAEMSPTMKSRSCGEAWVVRIDKKENWYLNSTKTSSQELPELLRQQLGGATQCAIYLDVAPSLNYEVAIHAVDAIQGTQAKTVVLFNTAKENNGQRPRGGNDGERGKR